MFVCGPYIQVGSNFNKTMSEKIISVFASYDSGPEWDKKQEHINSLIKEGFPVKLIPFLKLEKTTKGNYNLQKLNCEQSFYFSFMRNEEKSSHFVVHLGIGIRMRLSEFLNALEKYIEDRKFEVPFIFENSDLNFSYLNESHPDYQITKLILEKVEKLNSKNPFIEKMIFSYKNE